MRPIHLARLDKTRPVLILTRELVRPYLSRVTVAPITSTRGLSTELPLGHRNGIENDSVATLDNVVTIPVAALGRQLGFLFPDQEAALSVAVRNAFDLE